jgi:hypothetical protein
VERGDVQLTPTRAKINQLLDEAAALEPIAAQEEHDESLRIALEEEKRANAIRASLGRMQGKRPMGQPLSPLADVTGVEQTARATADIARIDETLAALEAV